MSVDDYRRRYEEELNQARAAAPAAAPSIGAMEDEALDDHVGTLVAVLGDAAKPAEDRLHALSGLQAAAFDPVKFEPYVTAYRQALRKAATDNVEDLRYRAMQVLADQKDAFALDRLLEGLRNPASALVSPAAALQFLAADDHGRGVEAARQVMAGDFATEAKEHALRLLASDPAAQDLITGVMKDKGELRAVRQAGAVALQALNQTAFARAAREVADDDTDFDDIRAVARNGLDLLQDRR